MRRRWLDLAAVCIVLTIFMLMYQRSYLYSWTKENAAVGLDIGSDWIEKGPLAEDKVVVIAKMTNESVDWVSENLQDWQQAIYHMDEPQYILHPPRNVGREAMAYLTFLIDHYDVLPEIIVFLHPHLQGWPAAWHNDAPDYNNVRSIQSLKLDYVRTNGYANMRCIHNPGCPAEIQPFRNDSRRTAELAFADAYMYFFGGNSSTVPEQVGTPCCSQFAVSRDQVRKRPRSDYQRYRQWLISTELGSDISGRVMEYMWHIMFGKDAVWCPSLASCYCEQFGRC